MNVKFSFPWKNKALYQQWRDEKLAAYPLEVSHLCIEITDAGQISDPEIQLMLQTAARHNLAFYRLNGDSGDKHKVHQLAARCGLRRIDHNLCADADSLTTLQVGTHAGQHDYIPYTNQRLSWHTDGYYNAPEQQINGMLLHCVRPAANGGDSLLMDHDIAFILLYEANPAYIEALMHPEAFTIPANILKGEVIRPQRSGPVFSVTNDCRLHMRYSARQRNVLWRDDVPTRQAAEFLLQLWESDSPYILRYRLQSGEGLVCNNVLHRRTAFTDSDDPAQARCLYRGRYLDALSR
ncbi:MAG: TauD/TfdA family dioxygenase [Thiolinea sp.]